jgi:hypothetical protein
MFAIPQMIAVPALAGVATMSLEWPMLGAFLAWTLIAALVGIGLGALRRLGGQRLAVSPTQTVRPPAMIAQIRPNADCNHLEAA